ncbi:hypothetical protein, partial [Streptomyces sp. HUAS TT7]|uniref:hypothetical protein n=1 Tax=Streptomyces sp. HUAS TT7 TaxID=3447507 RepID=UPI003F65C436
MTRMYARAAAVLAALFLLAGLAAPAVAAPRAVPASVPGALPAWDWWGQAKHCASSLIPNPLDPSGSAKKAAKCLKDAPKIVAGGTVDAATAPGKAVANSILGDASKSMAQFAGDFMKTGMGWWLMTDSVQVKDSGVLGPPEAARKAAMDDNTPEFNDKTRSLSLHGLMVSIGILIAVMLTMFQGIRMIIQRKGAPLAQVIQGLFINALVSAAGVGIIDALLIASDQLAKTILDVGFG